MAGVSKAKAQLVENNRFWGSTIHVVVDPALGKTAQQMSDELDAGAPRIWVGVQGNDTVTMNMHTLNDGEEDIIAERLTRILTT